MKLPKVLFFASAVLLFFCLFYHSIIEFDQDLGRHLLMGKLISATATVPATNLLSYTQPNFPFINSHWLSEVIFYLITNHYSLTTLLFFKVAVLIVAFFLTLFTAYHFSKSLPATALAFAIFVPILLERTEIRPEIFSYLFVAIFIYSLLNIYNSGTQSQPKLIIGYWFLVISLQLLWVNLHIYFILGPLLVTIFYLQIFWQSYSTNHRFLETIQITKHYALITLLIFLACLVNPNFLSGALYPFTVQSNYGYSIVENQNIFFLSSMVFNPNIFYFEIALALFLITFLITNYKPPLTPLKLMLGALIILPILNIRSFPLFFLIELPVFAHNLANINPKMKNFTLDDLRFLSFLKPSLAVTIVILLNLLRTFRLISNEYYLSIDSNKRFGSEVTESGRGVADFVLKKNLHGPLFNNFDIGSYLDYRLYPKEKVFVDGRPEAYPVKFFQNLYVPMQETPENFNTVDKIYNFNSIIFSHTDATPWAQTFLSFIINNPTYQLVYLDPYAVIFVKKETSSEIANKYKISPNLPNHPTPPNSYRDYLSLAQISATFGWSDQAIKFLQEAYSSNPNSPEVLQALGSVFSQNPTTAIIGEKYLEEYKEKTRLILF